MTKEQFIRLMTVIKKKYEETEKFWDDFYDLFGSCGDKLAEAISLDEIISVISEIIGDNKYWIEWYIYEKEWGIKEDVGVADANNNIIPSETLEDLWRLIQNSKEGDKTE